MTNYFNFSLTAKANQRITLGQLSGSSLSLAIAELVTQQNSPVVLITSDTPTALYLEQEISFLLQEANIPSVCFLTGKPFLMILFRRIRTLFPSV